MSYPRDGASGGNQWAAVPKPQFGACYQLFPANTNNHYIPQPLQPAERECLALDCEMVGAGPAGRMNLLARVSIVNQKGEVLMDKFVKPNLPVTDYRTKYSGIRPNDIEKGEEFNKVQREVVALIRGKVLVGHSINKDLQVLLIRHPFELIRDTAYYRPLALSIACQSTPSLKRLSKALLGIDIQCGEHSSIEDARAAMGLYNSVREDWETFLAFHPTSKFYHKLPY